MGLPFTMEGVSWRSWEKVQAWPYRQVPSK